MILKQKLVEFKSTVRDPKPIPKIVKLLENLNSFWALPGEIDLRFIVCCQQLHLRYF